MEMEEFTLLVSEEILSCFLYCKIEFRLKHEADDSFSSDAEIWNAWIFIASPPLHMHIGLYVKYPLVLSDFNET